MYFTKEYIKKLLSETYISCISFDLGFQSEDGWGKDHSGSLGIEETLILESLLIFTHNSYTIFNILVLVAGGMLVTIPFLLF